MEQKILLTYKMDRRTDFAWFEDEEEMNQFISSSKIEVLEAWRINSAEQIL